MVVFPNAKINIGLNVVSRRPDGYHDIETVMIPVGWSDILEIVPAAGPETTLTVTGRTVDCPPDRNLVMRALRAVEARCPGIPAVDIYLHKIIPDGAGLGGGSSDAAFTIKVLDRMFELGLSQAEMADIAASVGSDCPFFIYDRPMLCTGTGTQMQQFEMPQFPPGMLIAIVKPPQGVSTAAAYAGVTPRLAVPPVREAAARPVTEWSGILSNDFEPSVITACPEIGKVRDNLMSLGPVYCSMSGSGSAVYAFFDADKLTADRLTERLTELNPGCDLFVEPVG